MNSTVENILEKYGIHGSNLEKVASDDTIEKAKTVQEKLAQAISEDDNIIEKIAAVQDENDRIRIELLQYKEASEREKVANILEEKSLTSMAKIASLRNGSMDTQEFERLKIIADSNIIDSNFEHQREVKTAQDLPDSPLEQMERRRQDRTEKIYNDLQSMLNR
jgi:hypothetical protein